MRRFSYERSFGGLVFDAPNGATYPVSPKVVEASQLNAKSGDVLESIMLTMRSEPVEQDCPSASDKLDSIMFTMRSEPVEQDCLAGSDNLDSIIFTMRSEPGELDLGGENQNT